MRDEKIQLSKRKEDLELQTNDMNLPFPEAIERLMNRIKQDNAEIKQQDKELADIRKIIETYQRNIKDIDNDMKDKKKDGGDDMQKYEILYKKEKEINEYMEKFESEQEEYGKQITEAQQTIEALLMHMQKTLARQNKLPSQKDVDEMRDDLDYK